MILLRLFWEFFKTGLFTVGGGMATLPFLYAMGAKTGWFTDAMLADMVAVSESTPGPIGMNMATYVGYTTAGIPGAIVASLGLVVPSLIIITIIASMLGRFRSNKTVDAVFYGLRPCSVALIAAAGLMGARIPFLNPGVLDALLSHGAAAAGAAPGLLLRWKEILLAGIILVLTRAKTKAKDLHPVVFIMASAVVGILFSF